MKQLFSVLLLCCFALPLAAEPVLKPQYNAELAAELGADDYGMRPYVMAILRAGPNLRHDAKTVQALQRGHMDTIARLAAEGKLVLAGPFLDNGELRGIYIFNVSSVEEAQALTAEDPAVKAGRLSMQLIPWYGSAALIQLNQLHQQISKQTP
ncbi:YciI family protein [Arsukibacterium sp.]|uniref:YciI family protein n=1 Tax=Arsukibacterium sp. TaxID=1977258 RepID=UPI002FD8F9EC